MEYYSAIKKKLSSHEKTQKNLKRILLRERNQSAKAAYCIIPTVRHSGKGTLGSLSCDSLRPPQDSPLPTPGLAPSLTQLSLPASEPCPPAPWAPAPRLGLPPPSSWGWGLPGHLTCFSAPRGHWLLLAYAQHLPPRRFLCFVYCRLFWVGE